MDRPEMTPTQEYLMLEESTLSRNSAPRVAPPSEPSARAAKFSTGFDSSAFGSGSSVLSAFEPPNDAEMLESQTLNGYLDEYAAYHTSLEELRALIIKLQTIYAYRQGLEALGVEGHRRVKPHSVVAPRYEIPTSIPGTVDSIWKMDDEQLSIAARAVEAAATEMSTPYTMHPCMSNLNVTPHAQRTEAGNGTYRRKSRRQRSCPVVLGAPMWADASWNPRTPLRTHNNTPSHGTGVFLPPHLAQSAAAEDDDLSRPPGQFQC